MKDKKTDKKHNCLHISICSEMKTSSVICLLKHKRITWGIYKAHNKEGLCIHLTSSTCWLCTCCNSDTLPPSELQVGKLTLRKKLPVVVSLHCQEYFFSQAPSFSLHVNTRSVGWHTDLGLGWRPAAGPTLAVRPWETGGRHPNVITAAKLLSTKAELQKYVPRGLSAMKTQPRLSGCCQRSAVEVVLRYVVRDLLWARNSRFHSCWQTSGCTRGRLCGKSFQVNFAIILPC